MHSWDTIAPERLRTEVPPTRGSVLLLVNTLGVGGAERHTITLANLLAKEFDVVLVSLKAGGDADGAMSRHVDRRRLRALACLDVSRRFDVDAAQRLAKLQREHRSEVVLCANTYPLLYAQWARWRYGAPAKVVEVYHTTVVAQWGARAQLMFYRPFFWLATRLVFVCEAQRRYCTRRGIVARRMDVIHNGVDVRRFSADMVTSAVETRARFGFAPGDRVVGLCAVFRPEKAHTHLLEAVARLKARGIAWKVLLIGDGPERRDIESAIERLGLSEDVRITGFLPDVRDAIVACDVITIVSTSIETFSVAALEAMALGRPMIMSDVGGAAEQVIDGVNGLLFPPGNIDALTDRLDRLSDRELAVTMGGAARQRVVDLFSQETMLARYVRLVSELSPQLGRAPA